MSKVKPDKKVGSRVPRDRVAAASLAALGCPPRGETVPDASRVAGAGKVRLGDVFDLQMGKTPARVKREYWGGKNKWASIADIGKANVVISQTAESISDLAVIDSGIKIVPPNTLIMSFKLSIGKTAITAEPMYTNEAIMAFLPKPDVEFDLHYLYHQFSNKDWSAGSNLAVIGLTLNKKSLQEHVILSPPLPAQQRIADKLDRLCALKKNAEDRLAILDQIVKSRFVEMFGEEKRYELVCVGDVFKVGGPKRIHKEEWTKEGIPFLKISDLVCRMEDEVNAADCYISESRYAELKAEGQVPIPGDVLVTARGTLGRCYVVGADDKFYFQDGMISWLSNKDESIDLTYFLSAVQMPEFKRQYEGKSSGTTVAYLTIGQLAKLQLPLPPIGEQRKFAAFVAEVDKAKAALRETVATLDQLYRAKLQEYFG